MVDGTQDSTLAAPKPIAAGTVLGGKYRIRHVLGEGGMGVVVAATHLQLRTTIAIKVLAPSCRDDSDAIARFFREARMASRIRSEHVVRVFDIGMSEDGSPYIVMEHLEGSDFAAVLAERHTLSVTEAVDFLLQASEALAEAHAMGIVHRDLKPGNLFLTERADGTPCVKVLDFGVSKAPANALKDDWSISTVGLTTTHACERGLAANRHESTGPVITRTRSLVGSPRYMAPEQFCSARDVDARADVWALGALLYEFTTGAPPFWGANLAGLRTAILEQAPAPMKERTRDISPAFETVVLRCLAKDRSARFEDISALAAALVPFGSTRAATSAERIARVLGKDVGKSEDASGVRGNESSHAGTPREAAKSDPATQTRGSRKRLVYGVASSLAVGALAAWLCAPSHRTSPAAIEREGSMIASPTAVVDTRVLAQSRANVVDVAAANTAAVPTPSRIAEESTPAPGADPGGAGTPSKQPVPNRAASSPEPLSHSSPRARPRPAASGASIAPVSSSGSEVTRRGGLDPGVLFDGRK